MVKARPLQPPGEVLCYLSVKHPSAIAPRKLTLEHVVDQPEANNSDLGLSRDHQRCLLRTSSCPDDLQLLRAEGLKV